MAFATLPAVFVTSVADAAAACGGSRQDVISASGLTAVQLEAPESPVPVEAVFYAWERAMRQLDDAGFPIFYARRFEVERYPLLGFAVLTASRVEAWAGLRASRRGTRADNFDVRENKDRCARSFFPHSGSLQHFYAWYARSMLFFLLESLVEP